MAETLEALEEWEEYDPNSGISFATHALAGSLAGAAEHCAIFPVDTIKTHLQASTNQRKTPLNITKQLLNDPKGAFRLWRGVSTMLGACIPAHAAYFSIFEYCKMNFGANGETHTPIAAGLSGALATIAHDMIMTPMDVIKQRLQLGFYSGSFHCLKTVIATEGAGALYLSFPTTLLMNIPYASIMVATNESAKKILNPRNSYDVKSFVCAGALAGAVAAFMTNPMDVVKTRLQTQNLLKSFPNCENSQIVQESTQKVRNLNILKGFISHPRGVGIRATYSMRQQPTVDCGCKGSNSNTYLKYGGFLQTVSKIYKEEGIRGFSRGALSRVLVHAPSVAISWTTYETAKKFLQF